MQPVQDELDPTRAIAELARHLEDEDASANARALAEIFQNLEPDDLALALESLPLEKRLVVWQQIPKDEQLDVLVAMRGEARLLLLRQLTRDELHELFDEIESEDLIELAETVPDAVVDMALGRMDEQQRKYFEMAQQFPEESVGRWLNHDILMVSQNTRVADALRLLRREAPDYTEVLYLVDRTGRWAGCTRINRLLSAQPHQNVAELKEEDYPSLHADDDMYEAAEEVERSSYIALPVLSRDGVLLGRLDVGTAMDLLREQSENQLMASAGLAEDADLFAPVKRSAQTRAVWLGINLITAFLASWFIGLFEATIQEVVALAVLMPVVASMGGIAGSQTLTLIVRGLALGQISPANFNALLLKELRVGALNGVLWALVIGIVAAVWFDSVLLGLVIGAAIVANICAAALSGVLIPVLLDKLKLDPALSGSVILTTVTDIIGFVAFLGLGTLILL
jgi:magnesium transporter